MTATIAAIYKLLNHVTPHHATIHSLGPRRQMHTYTHAWIPTTLQTKVVFGQQVPGLTLSRLMFPQAFTRVRKMCHIKYKGI